MHYYEKLMILVVLFLGVTIGTAGIIGIYVGSTKTTSKGPSTIVLDNINHF